MSEAVGYSAPAHPREVKQAQYTVAPKTASPGDDLAPKTIQATAKDDYLEKPPVPDLGKETITEENSLQDGAILVESVPEGAGVYVDGELRGKTPVAVNELGEGEHQVQLRLEGYEDQTLKIPVVGGKVTEAFYLLVIKQTAPEGFVLVEAGSFQMGSEADRPIHEATIQKSFYIGRHEVTFQEYDRYCEETGLQKPSDDSAGRGNRPVIRVDWYDAVEYCNWRSEQEGLKPAYVIQGRDVTCDFTAEGYRLPTEAEWEYAAKGGKETLDLAYSGSGKADEVGWHEDISGGLLHEVGQKNANELGIYDMSGNAYEWCWDWYNGDFYSTASVIDEGGPVSGTNRVIRGGSWLHKIDRMRVSFRFSSNPEETFGDLGFRLVRSVPPGSDSR